MEEKTGINEGASCAGGTNSDEVDGLHRRVKALEFEKSKMQSEFNFQRAKLKELFVQTEQALQAENIKCQAEQELLQREVKELKNQLKLRSEGNAEEGKSSLQKEIKLKDISAELSDLGLPNVSLQGEMKSRGTPQVESTWSDRGTNKSDTTRANEGESELETQCDHEDAELLRSIVDQLQEEMEALKIKLREADDKLNEGQMRVDGNLIPTKSKTGDEVAANPNQNASKESEKIINLEKNIAAARKDLKKEAELRKELEEQWHQHREAHKTEVQKLRQQVKNNEELLFSIQAKFLDTKEDIVRKLKHTIDERERINNCLVRVQADNDFLSGRYLATAAEIESQYINLPCTIVELQELILRQQGELIQARASSEFEKQKCISLSDELQLLRAQLDSCNNERRSYRRTVQMEMKSLQERLTEHLLTLQNYETVKTTLEHKKAEFKKVVSELNGEILQLQSKNEEATKMNEELKNKIKILQEDLATGEQVQKDFVKLSQDLQMALEKLRLADTEVRWQDDEDVDICPSCKSGFTVTVRKLHCRHCGQIYCNKCLTKTVPSGPRKRNARVCEICHTLLRPNTAPYFSQSSEQTFS